MNYKILIRPFGESAILVEWPAEVSEDILQDILTFYHYLKKNCLTGADWEMVCAYNSLTLIRREKKIDFKVLSQQLQTWYTEKEGVLLPKRHIWKIPVCYEEEYGIDLSDVSLKLKLSIEEIIKEHTSGVYTLYGIGFLPGFMYLGGISEKLEIPRKETPRLKVMQGAVGLAAKQTGIYPQESPGGWNIIGNCPVPMFKVEAENPCFVTVGDKIQFYEVSKAEYELIKIQLEIGIFKLEKTPVDA